MPTPTEWYRNSGGLWCEACGHHIAAPWHLRDEDFEAPEICPNCGFPDEFDPEAWKTDAIRNRS